MLINRALSELKTFALQKTLLTAYDKLKTGQKYFQISQTFHFTEEHIQMLNNTGNDVQLHYPFGK